MPNTLKEYDQLIIKGFKARLEHDKKIAALTEKHIAPIKELQTQDWGNLSADTGIEKEDLKNEYNIYKRQEEAKALEEDDRNRILDNQRIIHHAQYNLLDCLDGKATDFKPLAIQQDEAMKEADGEGDEAKAVH